MAGVLDVVRPVLAANMLGLTQTVSTVAGAVRVTSTLLHSTGEWLTFDPLTIPVAGSDAQAIGSGLTYARRYATLALCNLATEDDDGDHASRSAARRQPDPQPYDWGALGWTDRPEHDLERERVRSQLAEYHVDVRNELRTKWDELNLAWPLSRETLADWDQTVEAFIAQHEPPPAPPADSTPNPQLDVESSKPAGRARTGPSSTAPKALIDEVRLVGAAAELTEPEILEFLTATFGSPIEDLAALTIAQARAAIPMLQRASGHGQEDTSEL